MVPFYLNFSFVSPSLLLGPLVGAAVILCSIAYSRLR